MATNKVNIALTEAEAQAWAAELDDQCRRERVAPHGASIDRGGWRMLQEYKLCDPSSEEYNEWHTLDDELDCVALLRGIHNIQERGGNAADEERFLNRVCDRFGHARFTYER